MDGSDDPANDMQAQHGIGDRAAVRAELQAHLDALGRLAHDKESAPALILRDVAEAAHAALRCVAQLLDG